jgi:hypothetical protein
MKKSLIYKARPMAFLTFRRLSGNNDGVDHQEFSFS